MIYKTSKKPIIEGYGCKCKKNRDEILIFSYIILEQKI